MGWGGGGADVWQLAGAGEVGGAQVLHLEVWAVWRVAIECTGLQHCSQ